MVVVAVESAGGWDAKENLVVKSCRYPAIWLKIRQRGVGEGLW